MSLSGANSAKYLIDGRKQPTTLGNFCGERAKTSYMKNKLSNGFTLIELLVVMAIVGSLVAISLPQYASYKRRAFDTRASMDLRTAALAEEAYFVDAEHYLSCSEANCSVLPGIAHLSEGVRLTITATSSGFTGTASHPLGSGKIFRWESNGGGMR